MEESEGKQPSQQEASEGGPKPPAPVAQPAPAAKATPPPARPVASARPAPLSAPAAPAPPPPKDAGRRSFMKLMFFLMGIAALVPFVPWGTFLSSTISTSSTRTLTQKAVVDDNESLYGAAAGQAVNVNNTTLFAPNNHWVITYPTSGDPTIDAENPDTFQKYELIRLPESLGGANKKATDFVAFSKVCVHLWCSPNYIPTNMDYECPCHGSKYQLPVKDPSDPTKLIDGGKAYAGPASLQTAPANAIPMLTLVADAAGDLYVYYPNTDPTKTTVSASGAVNLVSVDPIEADGELGYGRDFASYQNFLVPSAGVTADPKWVNDPVGP